MRASVGALTADLIARTKKFEAGMERGRKKVRGMGRDSKKSQMHVRGLGRSLGALNNKAKVLSGTLIGLTGIGGFGSLARSAIEFGSTQSDIAGQLKINTVAFQVYAGAIRDAGGSQEQMQKAILAQQQAIVQGYEGLTTYTRAFDRLGLSVDRLRSMKPEVQFAMIANAVANAKDQQGALTAVSEIYGRRNAPQLIEVMERLSKDGFGKLADEIRRTYGIMDEETQKRLDRAADRIEQFKQRATIRVGELIAGGNDNAALKMLGAQLMAAAARFGGGIIDAYYQSAQMGRAVFGATADFLADRLRKAFSDAFNSIKLKAGDLMVTIAERNPFINEDVIDKLKAAQRRAKFEAADLLEKGNAEQEKSWNDFFARRLDGFVKSDIAGSFGRFWDDQAAKQRGILDAASESASAREDDLRSLMSPNSTVKASAGADGLMDAAASKENRAFKEGFNIERMEGEGRLDFLKRRESARRSYLTGRAVDGLNTLGLPSSEGSAIRVGASSELERRDPVGEQILEYLQLITNEFTRTNPA